LISGVASAVLFVQSGDFAHAFDNFMVALVVWIVRDRAHRRLNLPDGNKIPAMQGPLASANGGLDLSWLTGMSGRLGLCRAASMVRANGRRFPRRRP